MTFNICTFSFDFFFLSSFSSSSCFFHFPFPPHPLVFLILFLILLFLFALVRTIIFSNSRGPHLALATVSGIVSHSGDVLSFSHAVCILSQDPYLLICCCFHSPVLNFTICTTPSRRFDRCHVDTVPVQYRRQLPPGEADNFWASPANPPSPPLSAWQQHPSFYSSAFSRILCRMRPLHMCSFHLIVWFYT